MDEELKARNPWMDMTEENIARCDKEFFGNKTPVKKYAEKINGKFPAAELTFDCLPEPFSGNPDSQVYCLNMNPGKPDRCFDGDEDFRYAALQNLALNSEGAFWTDKLVNKCGKTHDGVAWLDERTQDIGKVSEKYDDFDGVKDKNDIFFIEYFPYHSTKGFDFPNNLPSYDFSNALIVAAIAEGKTIIIMRKVAKWFERVPKLQTHCKKLYVLKFALGGYLSPNNIIRYEEYLKMKKRQGIIHNIVKL